VTWAAALGLASRAMPARHLAMGLLISPMVTPLIISAAGMFFFYSTLGLSQTHLGLILAHAALGPPFVVLHPGLCLPVGHPGLGFVIPIVVGRPHVEHQFANPDG